MFLVVALATIPLNANDAEPPGQTPARAPLERVKVDLILIDVEVRDAQGRPLPGLNPDDFDIRVNGIRRPLYSVDDRCACGQAPALPAKVSEESAPGAPVAQPASDATERPAERARFILYFDFALMDLGGRAATIKAARRWVTDTMRSTDTVTIVGSTIVRGAVVLVRDNSDRNELLSALEAMKESRDFVDAHFPFMHQRMKECDDDHREGRRLLPNCNSNALDEYTHTRAALRTLAYFLDALDSEERKHLVLFHEMIPFEPRALYRGARLEDTQEPAAELVGATAVASRVTIHAAGAQGADLVGQLAAEYTGGTFNRGPADLQKMLEEARNRCECLYRLGIEPLEKEKGRTVTITVTARNRPVANMRVLVRTDADRWIRKARMVLSNPGAARDLPVHAALVPVTATSSGWTVKVQVALHASALAMLPTGQGNQAEWETGAHLVQEGSQRAWDLLAVSTLSAPANARGPDWFVHERTLDDLPPGTYHLGAFVRDRAVDLFGGASATLDLPRPDADAVVGPIAMLAGRRILTLDLPLQPAPARGEPTRSAAQSNGQVPSGQAVSGEEGGPPLEIMTWLCGEGVLQLPAAAVERSVRYGDDVVMTFPEESHRDDAGMCVILTDTVEAGLLDDDAYRYRLRWTRPRASSSIEVEADLP